MRVTHQVRLARLLVAAAAASAGFAASAAAAGAVAAVGTVRAGQQLPILLLVMLAPFPVEQAFASAESVVAAAAVAVQFADAAAAGPLLVGAGAAAV